ncbi:3-keto-disaccharide hydrolase [Haloferula sargassicola]|uniref:3-keto-alpha-glucoside-1,2-lyase/3-keto-2-hydroxy-glucal hydratase domain-containing protein n=1 Tax=Haloferula sargassicola TaxID=490096 RepID=A0ABP9UIS2_9BACT
MKTHLILISGLLFGLLPVLGADPAPNTLTLRQKADGWRLLWDGRTSEGWRSAKSDQFPAKGWEMKDGILTVLPSGGGESGGGGDIITRERFKDFELQVDFRITEGANSGIKYYVQPNLGPIDKVTGKPAKTGSAIGLEFQILDDARHPDAKLGRNGNRTISSLYDLIPADADKKVNPVGEWNTARVVAKDGHVEHWLNGEKVVDYDRNSAAFRKLVKMSKYKDIPQFGEWQDGHILLQDHGNKVSFRNIMIRTPKTK